MLDDAKDMTLQGGADPIRADFMPTAFMAPKIGIEAIDHLPIVDIMEDPGIWVCFDEACDSNCHGQEWRENAERKLNLNAFSPVRIGT